MQSRVCCPRCGELLEIKADDEEITCPYCGCGIISKRESCGQDRIVESAQLSENDRAADGSRHLFYLIHIIGCLLAGSLIYFSFRPQAQISAFLQNLFDYRPDPDWLQMTKEVGIFRFINNYVPDILWAAALSFAMVCLLGEGTRNYLFAAGLCVSAEAGVELMQKAGLLRGTFDLWDIVSEIITTGFVLLIIIYHIGSRSLEPAGQDSPVG